MAKKSANSGVITFEASQEWIEKNKGEYYDVFIKAAEAEALCQFDAWRKKVVPIIWATNFGYHPRQINPEYSPGLMWNLLRIEVLYSPSAEKLKR